MKEQVNINEHTNCSCPNCVPGKMYQLPAQEQVSVDDCHCDDDKTVLVSRCTLNQLKHQIETLQLANEALMKSGEIMSKYYERLERENTRLKRLQDNFNKLISEKKNLFAKLNPENLFHAFAKHEIELLESLDK